MVNFVLIGRRIKYYRKKCRKTQAVLADELGVSAPYMSQIECGSTPISLDRLFEIASLINAKPQHLIADADDERDDYLNSDIFALTKDWSDREKEWLVNSLHLYNQYHRTTKKM